MQGKQIVPTSSSPEHPYSVAVSAGGFVHVSGTLADHQALDGDVVVQTTSALERMSRVLEGAGLSMTDVVSVMVYLTDARDFQAMNAAYRRFWPAEPPTRTTVVTQLVLAGARIEISLIAAAAGTARAVVHPAGWPVSPSPYSYGILAGNTLFLSGLIARRGRDNAFVAGGVTEQTRAIMENAQEILGAAGMSLADVVSSRIYLTDAREFAVMNGAYREYFPEAPPARATIQSGLAAPEALVEMTFVASRAPRHVVGTAPAGLPLSAAIRAGERVYVSGVLGNSPDTEGDAAAQTRETLRRIDGTLREAGVSRHDVVEATVYLTDAAVFPLMNAEYRAFFQHEFPARTTVVTPLVAGDALVEIMVTGVVSDADAG